MDLSDLDIIDDIIPVIAIRVIEAIKEKTPCSTGLPGKVYIQELLNSSPKRIYDILYIKKETFLELCD